MTLHVDHTGAVVATCVKVRRFWMNLLLPRLASRKRVEIGWMFWQQSTRFSLPPSLQPYVARAVRPRPSCSVCVLLSSLLLAVNLAKEVKYRGSSIVTNKKEVPLLLHSFFCLILYLFS